MQFFFFFFYIVYFSNGTFYLVMQGYTDCFNVYYIHLVLFYPLYNLSPFAVREKQHLNFLKAVAMLFQGLVSIWGFSSRVITPFVASWALNTSLCLILTNDSDFGTF